MTGEAFDFYYEEYAENSEFSATAKNYVEVKKTFIDRFGKTEAPEEIIQRAISSSLDSDDFRSSLHGMDTIFKKAEFDDKAKFGLLRRSVVEHQDLSRYVMFRNPLDYESLKASIFSFTSAKETFSPYSKNVPFTPQRVIHRPDGSQRKIENKVDALATQLSELSLIVKNSRTSKVSEAKDTAGKTCSYCGEPGHFSTTCRQNEHRNTRCASCGKLGHHESRCFRKIKKEAENTNVVVDFPDEVDSMKPPTVGVTLVDEKHSASPSSDVVASIKRMADGEPRSKQARPDGVIPISSLLATKKASSSGHVKPKKKRSKHTRSSTKQGLSEHSAKYDVVSELANASTNLTFGQLIRGDGEKAKSDIRRLLSGGAKLRRNVTAAVSAPKIRPRRLKVVKIKVYGMDSEALMDSGAVPNLISERLCNILSLPFDRRSVGLTVADGQRASSAETISDIPVSIDSLHISMDFYVMESPPFDVIMGVPTLEALRGCLDFGLRQVSLFAGDTKAVLPFEYAVVEVPAATNSDTESEDFTSDSDAAPKEDDDAEGDLIVALAVDLQLPQNVSVQETVSDNGHKQTALSEKVKYSDEDIRHELLLILKDSGSVAWSLQDLSPADVPVKHYFQLTDSSTIHHRAQRMAPKHNAFIRKELDNLLDAGIIVPASSAWAFPVVIATKKDCSSRFCVDYRTLNRVMKSDRWPLPRIDEIFDDLHGCTLFTTLDLFSGYSVEVRMADACKEMTTFVTKYGTYQFEVIPFGLMNAPSTFQRMMDTVLQGLSFVRVFIDEVVVFSRSIEDHIIHVRTVFRRLEKCNLKVKLAKCFIAQQQILLLGHIIDGNGVRVDDDKIAVIRGTPNPRSKTELRSFLGLDRYYRRFIKGFAEISSALHAATSGKGSLT